MLIKTLHTSYQQDIQKMNIIIDSSYDGISITDGQGTVMRVNSAWEKITGLTANEVIGKNMLELEKAGYFHRAIPPLALKYRKRITRPSRVLKTGREVLVTSNPIFDETGNITMVVTNVRDMTDLNNLNKQLERSKGLVEKYYSKLEKVRIQQLNLEDIVAVSKKMINVVELALRVAPLDIQVLIQGETGVGKEVVAKLIHNRSPRSRQGILMKINCGAIPDMLLESELFGYEKGAFTGAREGGKKGLFELAADGTLFLDEIDSLSLNLQSKLLSAIQDNEIMRVGGVKRKKINTRIIASSNRDIREMSKDGTFREDLYFRLNVVPIYIPPLRERQEDILPLINFFLRKFKTKYKKNTYFSRPVIDALIGYQWRGNVRELGNLVERLVVLAQNDEVVPKDLPQYIECTEENLSSDPDISNISSLKEVVREFEIRLIKKAIKDYGSAREAAQHLHVNHSTLTRKLQRYQIRSS